MKTVYFDVDTQLDFMVPGGSLYVPGGERIISNVAALNRQAAAAGMPIISTMDAHSENDVEFKTWPHHCVKGCLGQRKVAETLFDGATVVPNREGEVSIGGAPQILLEKQTVDCFSNMHLLAILKQLDPDRFLVYGVVAEICVMHAALGLLKLNKPVAIVQNAVRELDEQSMRRFYADFTAAGGTLVT